MYLLTRGKKMRGRIIERGIIFGIVVLLIITSIPSGSIGIKSIVPQQEIPPQHSVTPDISEKNPSVTFYTIGKHSMEKHNTSPSLHQRSKHSMTPIKTSSKK